MLSGRTYLSVSGQGGGEKRRPRRERWEYKVVLFEAKSLLHTTHKGECNATLQQQTHL